MAPRGAAARGLALISVDGQPPRAVAVGRELEPGLRLLTVSHRQAELGAARGAPAMTLALPPLAEAQRGRPGEAVAAPPAMPGAMPMFNRPPGSTGVVPPGMRQFGGGQPAMPGLPIQPQVMPQESDGSPTDNANPRS